VRLFSRQFRWLLASSVSYKTISNGDLNQHIASLVEHGFILDESHLQTIEETLHIMPSPKLKALANRYHLTKAIKRLDLIQALLKHFSVQKGLGFNGAGAMAKSSEALQTKYFNDCKAALGPCFKLNKQTRDLINRFFMMHFLSTVHKGPQSGTTQSQQSYM
jgi:hypothetical protein